MGEVIAKTLSISIFVMMISIAMVTDHWSVDQPESNGFDENVCENEVIIDVSEPPSRGTRTLIEGTVMGEMFPQDILLYQGYDYFTWGWEFEAKYDIYISHLGAYAGIYPYDYLYIDIFDVDSHAWIGGSGSCPPGTDNWTWYSTKSAICLPAGNYVIAAYIHTDDGAIMAVDNPGLTADGVIKPIKTVYSYGYGYPLGDYGNTPLPMVDFRYKYNFTADITVPDDYITIQEAINAANPGESIFVRENPMPYEEELTIDKTISLIGENRETTIIDAGSVMGGSGNVVHITGSHLNFRGFTITGGDCGVFLNYSYECSIRGNIIMENNDYGIFMDNTNNDTISFNNIFSNDFDGDSEGFGIFAHDSYARGVWHNYVHNNFIGVKLADSWLWGCLNWNLIYDNDIGVVYDPEPLVIDGNIFINNRIAIKISGDDSSIIITDNTIAGSEYGIYIESGSPHIEDNVFENNTYAIYYVNDSSPTIFNNTFINNMVDIFGKILAQINFQPDTLNLKSKGKWMTCYIGLPGDLDVNDIDNSKLRISNINDYPVDIPLQSHPMGFEDYDGDGKIELMVKFDRSEVQDAVGLGEIDLTLTGQLNDGSELSGSDSIIVKSPP